jgi:hypothetical protein
MKFFYSYFSHSAFKKIDAKQAYSIIHGLTYLLSCFLGVSALLISIIVIVSINLIVIGFFFFEIFKANFFE